MTTATSFAGTWLGGFEVPGGWRFVRLQLGSDGEASATDLLDNVSRLTELVELNDHLSFALRSGDDLWRFEGDRAGETISGFVTSARGRGDAALLRTQPIDDSTPMTGTYALNEGSRVAVFSVLGLPLPGSLVMLEIPTGEIRGLFPISSDTLTAGPGLLVPLPAERRLSFGERDGDKYRSLDLMRPDGAYRGIRLALREEEVVFRNGEVTLAGTLVLPRGAGPFPAIVVAHGSGDVGRDDPFAHILAERGFAFLRYDKRGVGASSGTWHSASFEDLADDLIAALRVLRLRADIDPERMGIWGWSQGGWTAPLAATRAPQLVSFLVLQSAPAVSPAEQELDRVEHELRSDGTSAADIESALAFMRRKFDYARTGEGWPAFAELLERAATTAWFSHAGSPTEPDSWAWNFFRLINDYDPIPTLERVHCPVLAMYGELDRNVVPAINAPLLQRALKKAGVPLTLQVFPKANHGLLECRSGGTTELPVVHRYVPGYLTMLFGWLEATVGRPN